MKRIFLLIVLTGWSIMWSGCGGGDDPKAKITPTNLTVDATISTDGSGLVTFQATADDATKFAFYFGEGLNEPFISTDGLTSHTYMAGDTYTVKVTAYSVDNLTIDKTIDITVQVNIPIAGYTTPDSYDGMTLVWEDEFSGGELNSDNWTFEIGGNGWGNNELEYYQQQNTFLQDGYLIIKAKRENVGGKSYTSSRIITKGKKYFTYGRVDIRALLPKGQGIWPALWMLGSNITEVGWPKCGEIDIMEIIGGGAGKDDKLYGTAHYDNGGYKSKGGNTSLTDGKIFADEFHVFSIVWTESSIIWYLDDVKYFSIDDITLAEFDEFHKEFFFIFNVAVGGNWPGSPDATTVFPQRMVVDYIRVFQPQ